MSPAVGLNPTELSANWPVYGDGAYDLNNPHLQGIRAKSAGVRYFLVRALGGVCSGDERTRGHHNSRPERHMLGALLAAVAGELQNVCGTRESRPALRDELFLASDALERFEVGLHVHDATGFRVSLDGMAARATELRSALDGTASAWTLWSILGHR
jgi:hypothetical protein